MLVRKIRFFYMVIFTDNDGKMPPGVTARLTEVNHIQGDYPSCFNNMPQNRSCSSRPFKTVTRIFFFFFSGSFNLTVNAVFRWLGTVMASFQRLLFFFFFTVLQGKKCLYSLNWRN